MAKGLKKIEPESVKTKSVDSEQTHDSNKSAAQILGREKKTRKDPKHYISHHHGLGKMSGKVVVKKGDKIEYVARRLGNKMVLTDGWAFGKKSEWKKLVRDV
jgi:hypothetical protein